MIISNQHISVNPFHAIGSFLCPLKTAESQSFSELFRGYKKRSVACDGLTNWILQYMARIPNPVWFNLSIFTEKFDSITLVIKTLKFSLSHLIFLWHQKSLWNQWALLWSYIVKKSLLYSHSEHKIGLSIDLVMKPCVSLKSRLELLLRVLLLSFTRRTLLTRNVE